MNIILLEMTPSGDVKLEHEVLSTSQYSDPEAEAIQLIANQAREQGTPVMVNLIEESGSRSHHLITEDGELQFMGEGFYQDDHEAQHGEQLSVDLDEIASMEVAPPKQEFQPRSDQMVEDAWAALGGGDGYFPDVEAERQARVRQDRRRLLWNAGLISMLVIASALVVWLGFFRPNSTASQMVETEEVAEQREQYSFETNLSIGDDDLPGYDTDSPIWTLDVGANSAVVAHTVGVVEIAPYTVHIYDPHDGKLVQTVEINEPGVDFLVETELYGDGEGQTALAFRSDDTLYIWTPDMDEDDIIEIDLEGRSVNDSGTGLLIYSTPESEDEEREYWYINGDSLEAIEPASDELTLTAFDDGNLVHTKWDGSITLTDLEGETVSETQLTPPDEGFEVFRWVAVGHGQAVIGWEHEEDNLYRLAIHDMESGEVSGSADLSRADLEEGSWQQGQGDQLGLFSHLVFDLETGQLVADGSSDNIAPDYARGPFTSISRQNDNLLTNGQDAWSSQLTIVGITDRGLIVIRERGQGDDEDHEIQAFGRKMA